MSEKNLLKKELYVYKSLSSLTFMVLGFLVYHFLFNV